MSKIEVIFNILLVVLGLSLGIFIGWNIHSPSKIVEVRNSVITIPAKTSSGISTKHKDIRDTVWRTDTVRINNNPECLPYQTFREDSILKIFITSYPQQKSNIDSTIIKLQNLIHTDTLTINNTSNGLSWWFLPVVVVETILLIIKLFN